MCVVFDSLVLGLRHQNDTRRCGGPEPHLISVYQSIYSTIQYTVVCVCCVANHHGYLLILPVQPPSCFAHIPTTANFLLLLLCCRRSMMMQEEDMTRVGERQTFMFSATFPREIQQLAADFMTDYIFLAVGRVGSASKDVTQTVCMHLNLCLQQ